MPTEITVRGSFSAFQAPERATVHATIASEGPAMESVYDRVARDLEAVKASVIPLKTGPRSRDMVVCRAIAHLVQPALEQGRQAASARASRERRHRGEIRDFSALSRWVGEHVATQADSGFPTSSGPSIRISGRSCSARSAPGRSKTPFSARSSMPTRSGWARSVRSPSPTPEC